MKNLNIKITFLKLKSATTNLSETINKLMRYKKRVLYYINPMNNFFFQEKKIEDDQRFMDTEKTFESTNM